MTGLLRRWVLATSDFRGEERELADDVLRRAVEAGVR